MNSLYDNDQLLESTNQPSSSSLPLLPQTSTPSPLIPNNQKSTKSLNLSSLFQLLKSVNVYSTKSPIFKLSLVLLFFSLVQQAMITFIGLIPGEFYQALIDDSRDVFPLLLLKSMAFTLGIVFTITALNYFSGTLDWKLRQLFTLYFHDLYLCNISFYKLKMQCSLDNIIDNPDQRITQDIQLFSSQFSYILAQLISLPLIIIFYSLYTIKVLGIYGMLIIYIFFGFTFYFTKSTLAKVSPFVVKQEELEGDFRYAHSKLRIHAESIAFFKLQSKRDEDDSDPSADSHLLTDIFQSLVLTMKDIVHYNIYVSLASNLTIYSSAFLNYILLAIPILYQVSLGISDSDSPLTGNTEHTNTGDLAKIISQTSFVIMQLIYSFNTLFDLKSRLALLSGYTFRLYQLEQILINTNKTSQNLPPLLKSGKQTNSCSFHVSNLSVAIRNSEDESDDSESFQFQQSFIRPTKNLISNLSFHLEKDSNLLIVGKSGCGKSSLLRVLAGLWPANSHANVNISFSRLIWDTGIVFLPQNSYIYQGSIYENIIYPHTHTDTYQQDQFQFNDSFRKVLECLKQVGFNFDSLRLLSTPPQDNINLFPTYNSLVAETSMDEFDPSASLVLDKNLALDSLSPGEKQRLSFARLIYHKPAFAILDESTSSLDSESEFSLYSLLTSLSITSLSVAHRVSTLVPFHKFALILTSDMGNVDYIKECYPHVIERGENWELCSK